MKINQLLQTHRPHHTPQASHQKLQERAIPNNNNDSNQYYSYASKSIPFNCNAIADYFSIEHNSN